MYLSPLEREIQAIEDDMDSGYINQAEGAKAIRELEREYRDTARESAQQAYEDELGRW